MAGQPLSSLNRRLRNICEREGMDYGDDAAEEEDLVRRYRVATQLMAKNVGKIMGDIKRAKTVDLCFLIDGTSTMMSHIEGVRDSVSKIVNTLVRSEEFPEGIEKVRLAMVVYRDFDNPKPMEVLEFTERPDECVLFCKNVKAMSGREHDPPEDVLGGIEKAIQLGWSSDAGSRVVFHMGDAPCHQYHASSVRDSYPNGDPKGRTSADLFKQIRQLGIDYYFGKISRCTDQMIDQFSIDYGCFIKTFNVEDIINIAGSVIASVSATVDVNVQQSKLRYGNETKQRSFKLETAVPHWEDAPTLQGTYLIYKLPSSVQDVIYDKPLEEKQVKEVRVKIAENPFAEGSKRIAYYGQDLFEGYGTTDARKRRYRSMTRRRRAVSGTPRFARAEPSGPTDIVLKEYKFLGKKQNTLERYMTASEVQTVAFLLADEFNKLTGPGVAPIKFHKTKVLLLKSADGLRIMSCERKFLGEFVKFTNNCTYSMQSATDEVKKSGIKPDIVETVMTFSHWTYDRTKGFLMVVDLQGCICTRSPKQARTQSKAAGSGATKFLMTDPALHCKDMTRYAPMNLGKKGMQAFFDGHRCSQLCRRLGLNPVDQL